VVVSARPGTGQEQLAAALRAVVQGDEAEVLTGDQWRTKLADEATSMATRLTSLLLLFGLISLVVAAFVIYNTFAILLAQRIRETALLRCVGATRRQVLGTLVAEAVVVGLAGSAAGLLAGVGVAHALPPAVRLLQGNDLPVHDVVLAPSSLLTGLVIGLVATVLSALLPALRATRVPPVAALRTLPPALPGGRRLPRTLLALLVAGLGTAVTVLGWKTEDSQSGTFIIVGGGVIVFLGVLIASPLFLPALTAAVGALLRPFAGATLRLAVANARRNPGRSAVTASALMIGIGLMALFSVAISSIQKTADDQLAARYPVDYVIGGLDYAAANSGEDARGGVPPALAAQLRAHDEFTTVTETRIVHATVRGGDPATLGAISDPTGNGVLLSRKRSWAKPVQVGDTVVISLGGKEFPLTVTGLADTTIPAAGSVDLLVPWNLLQTMAGPGNDTTVMVKARGDVTAVASRDILESYRDQYPLIEISSVADLSDDLETEIAGIIGLFGGLLGMTVLIALFGIANTLSLSVVERTRESATMRAIGLTRGQLRGTLLYEAVLLGIVSGVVGVAFGVLFGRIVVLKVLSDVGATVAVPWSWLVGLLALAAVASVGAGVLPARRAGGASIVAAMADDV
jgi:putative ABC transport system permease protein